MELKLLAGGLRAAGKPCVADLVLAEQPDMDSDRLVELFVAHGEAGARRLICEAIEAVGARVTELGNALEEGRFDAMVDLTDEVYTEAARAGLLSCARISVDLRLCAQAGNLAASAAVLHRLARHGSALARQSWSFQDLSS